MPLNKVTADSIADGTVIAADIADGAVTATKIASSTIKTGQFASSANSAITGKSVAMAIVFGG